MSISFQLHSFRQMITAAMMSCILELVHLCTNSIPFLRLMFSNGIQEVGGANEGLARRAASSVTLITVENFSLCDKKDLHVESKASCFSTDTWHHQWGGTLLHALLLFTGERVSCLVVLWWQLTPVAQGLCGQHVSHTMFCSKEQPPCLQTGLSVVQTLQHWELWMASFSFCYETREGACWKLQHDSIWSCFEGVKSLSLTIRCRSLDTVMVGLFSTCRNFSP